MNFSLLFLLSAWCLVQCMNLQNYGKSMVPQLTIKRDQDKAARVQRSEWYEKRSRWLDPRRYAFNTEPGTDGRYFKTIRKKFANKAFNVHRTGNSAGIEPGIDSLRQFKRKRREENDDEQENNDYDALGYRTSVRPTVRFFNDTCDQSMNAWCPRLSGTQCPSSHCPHLSTLRPSVCPGHSRNYRGIEKIKRRFHSRSKRGERKIDLKEQECIDKCRATTKKEHSCTCTTEKGSKSMTTSNSLLVTTSKPRHRCFNKLTTKSSKKGERRTTQPKNSKTRCTVVTQLVCL